MNGIKLLADLVREANPCDNLSDDVLELLLIAGTISSTDTTALPTKQPMVMYLPSLSCARCSAFR